MKKFRTVADVLPATDREAIVALAGRIRHVLKNWPIQRAELVVRADTSRVAVSACLRGSMKALPHPTWLVRMNRTLDFLMNDKARALLAKHDPEFAAWDAGREEARRLERAALIERECQPILDRLAAEEAARGRDRY